MPSCTSPLGFPIKRPDEFRPAKDAPIQYVSCGRCMACRLNHARNWSTRIVHEASLHEDNCFITLTYDDDHLPDPPSVYRREMQLWIKRLRKELAPLRIRYFVCGEYGTKLKRPHYHAIIFGTAFRKDRYLWSQVRGRVYYRSPLLEKTWPYGISTISDVTKQSAQYVAAYSVKKANFYSENDGDPYTRLNATTGEFYRVNEEFLQMSNRPGIGFRWIDKYSSDAFPSNFLIVEGMRTPIPTAYRRRLMATADDPTLLNVEAADYERYLHAKKLAPDDTEARRQVKDELLRLRTQTLKRDLE